MTTSNQAIHSHIPGFPRIGAARELKFALEANWRGELSDEQLEATGRELRARHWALQQRPGSTLSRSAISPSTTRSPTTSSCSAANRPASASTPGNRN
jgi:hypothetical protein